MLIFHKITTERIVIQTYFGRKWLEKGRKNLMTTTSTRNTISKVFLVSVYKRLINKFAKYHWRLSDLNSEIVVFLGIIYWVYATFPALSIIQNITIPEKSKKNSRNLFVEKGYYSEYISVWKLEAQ